MVAIYLISCYAIRILVLTYSYEMPSNAAAAVAN